MANEIQSLEMTKYLGDIYQLEKELYQIDKLCIRAKKIIKCYENPKLEPYEKTLDTDTTAGIVFFCTLRAAFYGAFAAIGGAIIGFVFSIVYNLGNMLTYSRSRVSILNSIGWNTLIFFIITFIIGLTWHFVDDLRHNKSCKKHNADANEKNKKIHIENERILSISLQKTKIAKEDLAKIQSSKIMLSNTLNSYYNKNIIFPKYRNLVAISSLYEYFVTGRCRTLGVSDSGHEGAYNIFERELRENRIISQLDQVIQRLDQIIDNQQMLYSAINECNASLNRIEGNMKSSFEKLQSSAEIIAYNSKITRQNTEYLAWLESTKWILDTSR